MRKRILYPCIVGVALLYFGCSRATTNDVLVVEKTKTYHTDRCPRVNMADVRFMTREEAKADGCKACPGCKPDSDWSGQP